MQRLIILRFCAQREGDRAVEVYPYMKEKAVILNGGNPDDGNSLPH